MTAQADSATSSLPDDRMERSRLRQQLRRQRRALPPDYRSWCARQVAVNLQRAGVLMPGRRIGVYLALPEELDLLPTVHMAWRQHCAVFVPHITHRRLRLMHFLPYRQQDSLRLHHWGIKTLAHAGRVRAADTRSLDVLLVPLVGFDSEGHRLGMGAGFYDRHCASRRQTLHMRRPLLVGVAFAAQQVAHLPHARHDVMLDAVVTERGIQRFSPNP